RFHGSRDKVDFELIGYNSRLDELQAAALRVFLRRLDVWTQLRREAAARYAELGLGELCDLPPDEPGHVYHLFVFRSPERGRIRNVLADAALIALAWWLAFWLRFDHGVPKPYERLFGDTIGIAIVLQLAVFLAFGFYNRWWRYVSTRDMWGAARGVTAACIVSDLVVLLAHPVTGFQLPRSVAVLDWLLLLALVAGTRLIARSLIERPDAARFVARGK